MLPKIDLPTYEIKLPSNGKAVTIRPFVVKEEKLLLMALESEEDDDIISTTKQIINNCIVKGDVDVDKLPFFDVDYLFVALRAKSIGESIDIKFTCNNVKEDGEKCGNVFPAKIDVSNCVVEKDETITQDIRVSPKITIRMKYPNYSVMREITNNNFGMDVDSEVFDMKNDIIINSIEYIVDGDNVISMKDITKEELLEFIEGLTQEQYKKLERFVDNFPSFLITAEATCDACGFHHNLKYKDFTSFFV
jgi:hypothetical protein